jgi:hypothetical protein
MPLAPGILINANGSTQLARTATPTPFKGPAKHGALREPITTGEFFARTPCQGFLSHLAVEPFGPLHMLAEGLTLFPGTVVTLGALKTPQMKPQHHGAFQYG